MSDIKTAAEYHFRTIYNPDTMAGGGMDWSNQPNPYKSYPGLESIPLPRELVLPRAEAEKALKSDLHREGESLDLKNLSNLLFMSYGFTSQTQHGTEMFLYRSAPSAGALYPIECYIIAEGINGLEDGLYHYSILDFALTRLRKGAPPANLPSPAIVFTGLFFRSAWKYRDRAYRYCLMDAGHVAENFMINGPVLGLEPVFSAEFDDKAVNDYLGLDTAKEAALAVVHLSTETKGTANEESAIERDIIASDPAAPKEMVFDTISRTAELTGVPLSSSPSALPAWTEIEEKEVRPADWDGFESPTLVQVLRGRRSRRNFRPKTLKQNELARALDLIMTEDIGKTLNMSFLLNEVEDFSDGLYVSTDKQYKIRSHIKGFIGPSLSTAALSQDWVGRANIIIVLSAPLEKLEQDLGPRALRLSYLAAGRIGQRIYLAAETMGWGCCGVGAFFDEQVRELLKFPRDEFPLYILPMGPVKKRTHGGRPS